MIMCIYIFLMLPILQARADIPFTDLYLAKQPNYFHHFSFIDKRHFWQY